MPGIDPELPVKQSDIHRLVSEWSGRTGCLATGNRSVPKLPLAL
jgi:hypothetical protein